METLKVNVTVSAMTYFNSWKYIETLKKKSYIRWKLGPSVSNYRVSSGAVATTNLWGIYQHIHCRHSEVPGKVHIYVLRVLDLHIHAQVGVKLSQEQGWMYDSEKDLNVWFLNQKSLPKTIFSNNLHLVIYQLIGKFFDPFKKQNQCHSLDAQNFGVNSEYFQWKSLNFGVYGNSAFWVKNL